MYNPPSIQIGGKQTKALYQFTLLSPDPDELYPEAKKMAAAMADVTLWKVAAALVFGIVLAAVLAFVLLRVAEDRTGGRLFKALFLALICVYALGFAVRYAVIEIVP